MDGKKVLNQLSPYQQGKQIDDIKKDYKLGNIVKLASNENPFGYSKHVKDFFSTSLLELNIYPDGHASELRTEIASKLNIDEAQLVFGSGSDEIIQTICRTFLYPGVNTIMATPTFSQYKHNALIEGADIKEIETKNGYHDLASMLLAINEKTKVVWICAPDNPTGTLPAKKDFYDFMSNCPKNVVVVLDEAYYEFIEDGKGLEALTSLPKFENLIILRTFSKAYGLAGLRVGYGIMQERLTAKLNTVRGPFNTSSIAQKAALIAFNDAAFIQETVIQNQKIKHTFQSFLDGIGWNYYDSQTNFMLVTTPISGTEVFQYLIENGYIIRPGELLGYPDTIRITIGKEEDMLMLQELLETLHQRLTNEV